MASPPLHLDLTISSLGAEDSQRPQKHTKHRTQKDTKPIHIYTSWPLF